MTDPTNLTIITGIFVFSLSRKQKKPHRDIIMHLSSLQLVPLCEKQADGMDQEEGIQSSHYLC